MDGSISPGMLVAAPSLSCPFFNHSLVLLVEHGDEGSFGFVVNRASEVRFDQVLEELGLDAAEPSKSFVMSGGPVNVQAGWIIFDPRSGEWPEEDTLEVDEDLGVSSSLDMLRTLAEGHGPNRFVMALGYAGWGPGQLEQEMREGAWIPVDLDTKLIFDVPVEDRWSKALASLGIDPARVATQGIANA